MIPQISKLHKRFETDKNEPLVLASDFLDRCLMTTPRKTNIDAKKWPYLKPESPFPNHHFGYPAVRFRGCIPCSASPLNNGNHKQEAWMKFGSQADLVFYGFLCVSCIPKFQDGDPNGFFCCCSLILDSFTLIVWG